ncbi:hypothetical protein ACMATS_10325 [Streptoverticillium reticulum]|uniref:hypothetical protein n=1 Tax=Streptoverticillium reticulum TaxID=1433415 RepID=UPI0039BEE150
MVAVALMHNTNLMSKRLPEPPPRWSERGERSFAYPHNEWRRPRSWCLAFFTNADPNYEQRHIMGIGAAFPGRRSGTYERTVIARDFKPLDRPLRLTDLERPMESSRKYLHDDGRLPPVAGQRLVESIRQLRPETADALADLEASLDIAAPTGPAAERLSFEKDAVGTMLDASGIDRDHIEAWRPLRRPSGAEDLSIPFLEGLPDLRQIEDQQIAHDYHRFPGMEGFDAVQVGWRVFRRPGGSSHRLFVYNANRSDVETVMGVDMIYVNEFTQSVTTVQYKRMRQEGRSWVYRHDVTTERELERMRSVDKACEFQDRGDQLRLLTTPSMVKLCRTVPFVMGSTSLIPGMYLTREHFEIVLWDPDSVGPRSGRRILEEAVPRYLNNTTFTTLLKDGWLGARGVNYDYLLELIQEVLVNGAGSVVVGVHRSDVPPGNRRVP